MLRVRGLWVLLLLAPMLAGCSGDKASEEAKDGDLRYSNVVDIDDKTQGFVAGTVLTMAGTPIPGALVTILSHEKSATSDARGDFNFTGVQKGEQTLRVEKDGYKTLQRPFEVVAGKINALEVVLARADGLDGDLIDHYHDLWRGQDRYTVYEGRIEFDGDLTSVPPGWCDNNVVYEHPACETSFDLLPGEGRIVPPGTSKLTFDVVLEEGPLYGSDDISGVSSAYTRLYVYPPPAPSGQQYNTQTFIVEPGSNTFEFEIPSPELVDHGHSPATNWRFRLSVSATADGYWASAYNSLFRSAMDVTITAHKGDLFIDPPHPRYWEKADRIAMPAGRESYGYCTVPSEGVTYSCAGRSPIPSSRSWGNADPSSMSSCSPSCMVLNRGALVPPDTTRLEFDLETWYDGVERTAEPPWALTGEDQLVFGYKTARTPVPLATWDDYAWIEPSSTIEPVPMEGRFSQKAWHYVIDVNRGEEDPPYTAFTNWVFQMAVKGHETADTWSDLKCSRDVCGYLRFQMSNVMMYNDNRDEVAS